MLKSNSLYKILSVGTIVLGIAGCKDRYNANVDLDFDDTLTVKVEQSAKILQDIDGDGKPDLVYVIEDEFRELCEWKDYRGDMWSNSGASSYELVWRKNLGDGRFDPPKQIMKTRTRPDGFQILFTKGNLGYKKKCKRVKGLGKE